MHYDTSASSSRRGITALLYLNPNWQSGDGGEIELLPFPLAARMVAPLHGRTVVFCSTQTLHRVMPSTATRMCISVWFASHDSESLLYPSVLPQMPPLPELEVAGHAQVCVLHRHTHCSLSHYSQATPEQKEEDARAWDKIANSVGNKDSRRLMAKVFHRNEYTASFVDAFGDSPALRLALSLDKEMTDDVAIKLGPSVLRVMRAVFPLRSNAQKEGGMFQVVQRAVAGSDSDECVLLMEDGFSTMLSSDDE